MFESRGVNHSGWYGSREERVHGPQLAALRQMAASGPPPCTVAELIASDDVFRTHPDYAYALSWGLTFYLAETQPREYFAYLRKLGVGEAFADYDARQRLLDFAGIFDPDLVQLEQRMWQFLNRL